MLFLFRKIRQKLMQQNNVSKYLLYAFGEITLVMIWILLALQVNNWNENRKDKIRATNYKKSLIKDLQQDSVAITEVLATISLGQKEFQDFQKRLTASTANLDTAYQIARYEVGICKRIMTYWS